MHLPLTAGEPSTVAGRLSLPQQLPVLQRQYHDALVSTGKAFATKVWCMQCRALQWRPQASKKTNCLGFLLIDEHTILEFIEQLN